MRLFQRAHAPYALSMLLCAVLIGAMAVPSMAAKRDGRSQAAEQSEQAQDTTTKKNKKDAKDDKKPAQREGAGQSSRGDSSSAASHSPASTTKPSSASSTSNRQRPAAAKKEKTPATAHKQDSPAAKAADEEGPDGNNGSMKVRPVGTAAHPPRNVAHLPCTVQVDFYGSPYAGATLTAVSHPPTSPAGQTLVTRTMTFSQSSPDPRGNELVGTTTMDFTSAVSGLTYHEQQGYHVKLTAVQDGPQGGDVKHKVFWIDCPPPAVDGAAHIDEESRATPVTVDGNSASTSTSQAEVNVDRDHVAAVKGLSGEHAEVMGVAVERGETIAAADGRVLSTSGAVDAAGVVTGRNTRALAATGVGVLTLALIGLFGLGGGAGILRRFRQRQL